MTAPTAPAALPDRGSIRLRVRYCECDPMGYVHHASYLPWLEMGRTEILRAAGGGQGRTYKDLEAAGYFLVIAKLDCRFRRPGRYDDIIEVRTRVTACGRVKIEHSYEVVRISETGAEPEELLMTANSTLGCVDAQGQLREMPDWLRLDESPSPIAPTGRRDVATGQATQL